MTEERKVIFEVRGKVVPVKICFTEELPVYNPRYTYRECTVYTGLFIKKWVRDGREYWYLNAIRKYSVCWSNNTVIGPAIEGSILYIAYRTGSGKHTYHRYSAIFMVKEGEQSTVELRDERGDQNIKAELTNLVLLQFIGDERLAELEAEILNNGWTPSQYDPVITLYHYFVKTKKVTEESEKAITLTFKIKTVEDIDKAIEKLRELREKMVSTPSRVKSLLKSLEDQH